MSNNTQFEPIPDPFSDGSSEKSPQRRSGKLIVLEGVEGSGKTTQIQAMHTWLTAPPLPIQEENPSQSNLPQDKSPHNLPQGRFSQYGFSQCLITREPGGTELGKELRQLLLHSTEDEPLQDRTELLLYAADRAQHVEGLLKPLLAQGTLILCDRYTDSTVAYQGYGRQLDRALIDQLNHIATGGLQSDLTLWLDLDVELGLARAQQRGSRDRIEQATIEFHRRVQQGFADLATAFPDRIVRIDAGQPPEQVTQKIQAVLSDLLSQWRMG